MVDYSKTETGNKAYLFFTGNDEPDVVRGIELYTNRSELDDVHLASSEFKTFAGALQSESVVVKAPVLDHYTPKSGFLTRPSNEASPTGTFIWLAEVTCKDKTARDESLKLAEKLASYVEANEPKTLSYQFLSSDDDETKFAVFEQYTNKEALTEIHHKSEVFSDFQTKLKDSGLVTGKTSSGYTTKTGYLSK